MKRRRIGSEKLMERTFLWKIKGKFIEIIFLVLNCIVSNNLYHNITARAQRDNPNFQSTNLSKLFLILVPINLDYLISFFFRIQPLDQVILSTNISQFLWTWALFVISKIPIKTVAEKADSRTEFPLHERCFSSSTANDTPSKNIQMCNLYLACIP